MTKQNHLLIENELQKLQAFDSIYVRGKSHFEGDGTQNYLAFQPIYRYFKRVVNSEYILDYILYCLMKVNLMKVNLILQLTLFLNLH